MSTSLEGHVAVVTGAAMGIGKEVAKTLAERGANVACWDIVEAKVQETASEIQASGNKALGLHVDVTDSTQVQHALRRTVEALGTVDILVNVAGGSRGAPPGLDTLTEADWDKVVNLNMRAPFLTCKAVAGMMKDKGWGRIVNIASGAGRSYSRSGVIPYAAAKAGLLGLTRQLAVEHEVCQRLLSRVAGIQVLEGKEVSLAWSEVRARTVDQRLARTRQNIVVREHERDPRVDEITRPAARRQSCQQTKDHRSHQVSSRHEAPVYSE